MIICIALSIGLHRMQMFESNIVMIYLAGTLLNSYLLESYPFSIIASAWSVLLYNYFFAEPAYTFKVNDPNYLLTFTVMFLVALYNN